MHAAARVGAGRAGSAVALRCAAPSSAACVRGAACTAVRAGAEARLMTARAVSTFSYVKPGPVEKRVHKIRWHESERYEEWKADGIPVVDDGMPEPARGRLVSWWNESLARVYGELDELQERHPQLYLLHALRHALESSGPLPLTDGEWGALSAPPTEAESAAVASQRGLRDALDGLKKALKALRADLKSRVADAVDSGDADLTLPIPPFKREALLRARAQPAVVEVLRAARSLSIISSKIDADTPPARRAEWRAALEGLDFALPSPRLPADAAVSSIASTPLTAPLTAAEVANYDHLESFPQAKQAVLENRDRTEPLSRKRLPMPLAADAPNVFLADAARLVDDNPSLSADDKRYIMQYYTDALADKPAAWDVSAEVKAIVEPQPQWGVYDPAMVKMQDEAADALQGKGIFSREKGRAINAVRVPPASIGEADVNAGREPLDAATEVARTVAAFDSELERKHATAAAALSAGVARSLGLPAAAAAAGKANGGSQAARMGAAAAASGSGSGKSFFQGYLAGERLPLPSPPQGGHRKTDERIAAANDAGGGGKGGGKGGAKGGAKPAAKPAGKK